MDVCVCDPNTREWTSSVRALHPAMRDAYAQYKERPHYYRETPYTDGEYIVYRPDNDPYLPTYIARIADVHSLQHGEHISIAREIHDILDLSGHAIPIIDLADISVFITYPGSLGDGSAGANWFPARSYQVWAYRDFMYDRNRAIKKSYKSRGSAPIMYESNVRILANQIVTIALPGIESNIIFNIARNANNSVYFERNDEAGSQVRICDNEYARAGYLGFYTRITMDPGIVTTLHVGGSLPTQQLSIAHLPGPEETDDEAQQCILCVRFRINARFSPCEHKVCCSQCYSQLSKNECPVCRAEITRVMNV